MNQKLPPAELRAEEFLSNDQLIAIGKVAVEWAMLEHALCAWGSSILRMSFMTFTTLTGNPGGRVIAGILKELSPQYLKRGKELAELLKVLKRIEAMAGERNDVVHGVWNLPAGARGGHMLIHHVEPVPNVVVKARGKDFKWEDRSTEDILDLAERIATTRLDLNRVVHALGYQ